MDWLQGVINSPVLTSLWITTSFCFCGFMVQSDDCVPNIRRMLSRSWILLEGVRIK
jgi:hypothetical protein